MSRKISSIQYVRHIQDLWKLVQASLDKSQEAHEQVFPADRKTVLQALWGIFEKMQIL